MDTHLGVWEIVGIVLVICAAAYLYRRLYSLSMRQRSWKQIEYSEPICVGPVLFGKERNVNDPPIHILNGLLTLPEEYRSIFANQTKPILAYAVVVIDNRHIRDYPMCVLLWELDEAIIDSFAKQIFNLVRQYHKSHGIEEPFAVIRSGVVQTKTLVKSDTLNVANLGIFLPWVFYSKE